MRYSVAVQRRAQKRLARFPTEVQSRIEESLQALSDDLRPPGSRKLQGSKGWRIRAGDYRAIHEIDGTAPPSGALLPDFGSAGLGAGAAGS